ncbi:MAG: hypothetical protein HQL54_06585 [Magnetococcales bacterium]|nr:hypothetical protein [Magnetococcales bacterium]
MNWKMLVNKKEQILTFVVVFCIITPVTALIGSFSGYSISTVLLYSQIMTLIAFTLLTTLDVVLERQEYDR